MRQLCLKCDHSRQAALAKAACLLALLSLGACTTLALNRESDSAARLARKPRRICPGRPAVQVPEHSEVALEVLFGLPTVQAASPVGPVRFLIDTGSQFCLLRAALVEELDLPVGRSMRLALLGGETPSVTACFHHFRLGSLRAEHLPFVVSPGHLEKRFLGIRLGSIDGVLGMPFLREVVTTVDFPGGKVRFTDPEAYRRPRGAYVLPIAFLRDGRPCVAASFSADSSYLFLLDTGARRCVVHTDLARQLNLPRNGTARLFSMGNSVEASLTTIPLLRLSGLRFREVRAYILPATENHMLQSVRGLIGIDLFRDFALAFDPDRKLLILAKEAAG